VFLPKSKTDLTMGSAFSLLSQGNGNILVASSVLMFFPSILIIFEDVLSYFHICLFLYCGSSFDCLVSPFCVYFCSFVWNILLIIHGFLSALNYSRGVLYDELIFF
jgi:hypothetical protein